MFFLSGKGCSEFPKRMLISIGILNTIVKVCELKNTNRLLNLCIINSINNTDKFFVRLLKTFPYESKQHHPNNHNEKAISYIIARFFPFHDCFPTIFNICHKQTNCNKQAYKFLCFCNKFSLILSFWHHQRSSTLKVIISNQIQNFFSL